MIPSMRDSRGAQSMTLTFVSVSWLVVTIAFVRSWLWPLASGVPMGASEYGAAVTAILVIWLGREWTEKGSARGKPDEA